MSPSPCCSCMLFDWDCLKEQAMMPAFLLDTDVVLVWAVNNTHTEHIKPLIGKNCYNALCAKAKQEALATPFDVLATYSVGEVVVYNELYYECTNASIGNIPTNPLFWAVAGFNAVDKALIAMLLPYAALLVDYYYRLRRAAGDITPSGVAINAPDNTALPQLGAVSNLNKVNFDLAIKKERAILEFLQENAADYPCFVPTSCPQTCDVPVSQSGFVFL